jgi:DNA-binding SARP family transcriptional activator/TolB-like protein/Tfp pilus assembly protein PilF
LEHPLAGSSAGIRLTVLGRLDLTDSAGLEVRQVLTQPKRLTLLVYLALASAPHFRRRDTIVSLFWPELDDEHARGALRQALRYLRGALGPGVVVARGQDDIGVSRALLQTDAVSFEEALDAGDTERAMDLYAGDFLDGVHVNDVAQELDEWVSGERARLRTRARDGARRLAEESVRSADGGAHERWTRRAIALGGLDETDLVRLLRLLDGAGDRAGALRAYEDFSRRLAQEVDAEPSPETQALVRTIRERVAPSRAPAVSRSAASGDESRPPPGNPAAPAQRAASASLPSVTPTPRRWTHRIVRRRATLGIVLASLLGAAAILALRAPPPPKVAVLPIQLAPADSALAYLADGLTDAVMSRLSRGGAILVSSADAVRGHGGPGDDVRAVGRRLGVSAVALGRLRSANDTLWLNMRLVRVADGAELVSSLEPMVASGLQEAERRMADRIAGALHRRVDVSMTHAVNGEAYAEYVRGQYYLGQRDTASVRRARNLFAQAIDHDPAFADAYAGLAYAYGAFAHDGVMPSSEAFRLGDAAARQALKLDPGSGLSLALLAGTKAFKDWRWPEAEAEMRAAIAVDPLDADVRNQLTILLRVLGRYDEALAEAKLARSLAPLARHYARQESLILNCAGRFEEALSAARAASELGTPYQGSHDMAARALAGLGRYGEALAELQGTPPGGAAPADARAAFDEMRAKRAQARRRKLEALPASQFVPPFTRAAIYAALSEWELAFHWLEQARKSHDVGLVKISCVDDFDPVRADPRFVELMREVGIPSNPRAAH